MFEDILEEGNFRTKNAPGQNFRTNLVDRGNQLVTKVRLVGITHGELAGGEELATLLVFEFRFVATGGRRFTRAKVTMVFESPDGKMDLDPIVHSIAPEDTWALNKTEKVQDTKLGSNAGVNAGLGPAGAELGVVWEVSETKTQKYFVSLSGVKRLMRAGWDGEENAVVWTLEENKHTKDGIPTFLRAAVLLSRPDDVPFSFKVKVDTQVDMVGELRSMFGAERKDPIDPVEIDPTKSANGGRGRRRVAALDPDTHDLKRMDELDLQKVADVVVVTVLDGEDLGK